MNEIYIWILLPTACVDPALGNGVKGEFKSIGENYVGLELCKIYPLRSFYGISRAVRFQQGSHTHVL